jgi:hypothetical protein
MQKYFKWFSRNSIKINWFLIGYFVSIGLTAFAEGNYSGVAVGFGFAGLNYLLGRD